MRKSLTTRFHGADKYLLMERLHRIHRLRQPRRPHFIPEWAEQRGWSQAELAKALEADKSVVSRWFHGTTPGEEWQEKLAALFEVDPESLFRHPDDDWLSRFLQGRSQEEVERIKRTLESAFPPKTGTDAN